MKPRRKPLIESLDRQIPMPPPGTGAARVYQSIGFASKA